MPDPDYDPAARKERYERTKQLKGRPSGARLMPTGGKGPMKAPLPVDRTKARAAAAQRVKALNAKLGQLRDALAAARKKEAAKPSAGEKKAKDDAYNEKYYNENKQKIANDRKAEKRAAPSTSGGSSSGSSGSPSSAPAARGVAEIEAAIKNTLTELKAATAKLSSL